MADKTRVAVVFGSRTVEHEVSVVTGQQVMAALDPNRYEIIPIYITKAGDWLTGDALRRVEAFRDLPGLMAQARRAYLSPMADERALIVPAGPAAASRGGLFRRGPTPSGEERIPIDVVFPTVHGTYGEDGTLQGLFELAGLPYVGAGVVGAAVGMDKVIMKAAFHEVGLPTAKHLALLRSEWRREPRRVIERITAQLGYPLFVKPANLGSSIGISKASDSEELSFALDVAAAYDRRLLVEESVEGALEINCAVLGNDSPIASVCEQPISWQQLLTYEEKYLRGGKSAEGMKGQERRIPAPIPEELTETIQRLAVQAFQAIDCRGIARVDFLVTPEGQPLINEINTLPGSLAFYLWEASGVPFGELCDRLIALAFENHAERQQNTTSYDSALLAKVGGGKTGLKD